MPETAPADPWGTCVYCGDAVPPHSPKCPICGAEGPLRPAEETAAPRRTRRRVAALRGLRAFIVVLAVIAIAYLVVSPVFTGPPVIADPLTTSGSYVMGPGNTTILAGEITGADYVLGNFTVLDPYGTSIGLVVLNTTEYLSYRAGFPTANQSFVAPTMSGRFYFAAPYTDTFYLVFYNPYPAASGLILTAYIATVYTPNVNSFS